MLVPDVANTRGLLLDVGTVDAGESVVDLDDLPLGLLAHRNNIFEWQLTRYEGHTTCDFLAL